MKIPFFARGLGLAVLVAATNVDVSLGQQLGDSGLLEKAWKGREFDFTQQARGLKPPVAADLELAAKFFVYRITWDDASMSKSVAGFNQFVDKEVLGLSGFGSRGDNSQFKSDWTKALVIRFGELTEKSILEHGPWILHGAQMFQGLAKMQQEEAAVYLQDIIGENSKNSQRPGQDGLRLHALRALGEMLPVTPWNEPPGQFLKQNKANLLKKARDLVRIKVLTDFIQRPAPTPPTPETLAPYRYFRREAIEALAKGGWPAVDSYYENNKSKVEGPIALTLMKVIVPGNMNPSVSLAEKNEAALGLLSLKGTSTYDGRPSLPFIADTLIEMNKTYAVDLPNIKGGQAHFAWKIEGARWKKALEILVDPVNGPFCKDAAGLKLAETFEGKAKGDLATGATSAWMKHGNPINTLKLEDFRDANLKNLPNGPFPIFKGIESPNVEHAVGPRAGIDPKE